MKYILISVLIIGILALIIKKNSINNSNSNNKIMEKMQENLKNEKIKSYSMLKCMYDDGYFPKHLVDKSKAILIDLCYQIEATQPKSLDELYKLSQEATRKFNYLDDEFLENDSEIETGARECIAENFDYISKAYGYDADIEELIATRNW